MPELVIHYLEAIEIDQVEHQVAMICRLAFSGPFISTHRLIQVRIDHAGEVTAIARLGERIGKRSFLEFAVGFRQGSTALGHRSLQSAAIFFQRMGPQLDRTLPYKDE